MEIRSLSVVIAGFSAVCALAGCESCSAKVDNTVTLAVAQGQSVREIICFRHEAPRSGVAEIGVHRSERAVVVRVAPLGRHRVECAEVCVSTVSDDPDACSHWLHAARLTDGSRMAVVSETEYEPLLCTVDVYVHVRLRVTHDGSCDI